MNIEECAAKYAAERANKVFVYALAEAYKDGYRDGYNDHKANPMAELVNDYDEVEYVDLGLPSGTLWSKDYLRKDGKIIYLPFCEARKFALPTEEQWKELVNHSSVTSITQDFKKAYKSGEVAAYSFTSRIGNGIIFDTCWEVYDGNGVNIKDGSDTDVVRFWLAVQTISIDTVKSIRWDKSDLWHLSVKPFASRFVGDKIPVRLVKQKEN